MTVIDVQKDKEALTLTLVAEFKADVDRVWQVWEDPRQLERWWGPPTWPATFDRFEFRPDGYVHYWMTGPDGTQGHGWWIFERIDSPGSLQFIDGFADQHGEPVDKDDYATVNVTLEEVDGKTRMTTTTTFLSIEQLERMMEMGMELGMSLAMGQIDTILAES